jgi:gliding motility-associated-like protein
VANRYSLTQTDTVCEDELPYLWNGLTFNTAGTQSVTLQTVEGCDSVVTMTLHVAHRYNLTQTVTICENELPYLWNGLTFTEAGTQTVTLQTVEGCDSVVTMTLAVNPTVADTVEATACDSYAWADETFTESGDYMRTFMAANGCDSTVTLHLTVNPSVTALVEATACNSYTWNGETYHESGDYNGVFATVHGCDSTVLLHLVVIDTTLEIISLTEDFCESMSMELAAVTAMTDYHWSTGEELPNITVTQPGIYSVTASQGGCRATAKYAVAACDFHLWLPNAITPSKNDGLNDVLCLPLRAQSMINDFEISIFDRWGEQVFYSTDKAFQWDGSVDGKTAVNAVYNYVIRYTLVGGKPSRAQGSVTVL